MNGKRWVRWAGTVVSLAAVLAGLGCSRARQATEAVRVAQDAQDGKYTVKNEKGETVTVDTTQQGGEGGKVTATTKEGTTTSEYGKDKVSEKDVGVAFYPGAQVEQGSKFTSTEHKGGQAATVSLTTNDSFDKVVKFYRAKYSKGNTVVEQPNQLVIGFKTAADAGKMVLVRGDQGQTKITITSSAKP